MYDTELFSQSLCQSGLSLLAPFHLFYCYSGFTITEQTQSNTGLPS